LAAQMNKNMADMDLTYTGCLEATSSGRFTLTDAVVPTDQMGGGSMKGESMKKDGMAGQSMKDSSMKEDAMAGGRMKGDRTMPKTLALSSMSVDLREHVGHKVTVTGRPAETTSSMGKDKMGKEPLAFTVTSMQMVSASGAK